MHLDFVKLWPTILLLGANLVDAFSDQITAYIAGHPKVGLVIAGIITLLANATKGVTKTPTV
jgi:hypothetical protein